MLDSSANMRRPQAILGAHKNGRTYLPPCLESHAPLDLVIIMLGTDDLKSRFGLGAHDIAAGAGQLVKLVSGDVRGQNGLKPQVLLVCPCPIGPLNLFSGVFAGGVEKSQRLHAHYPQIAAMLGCHVLNAGDHAVCSSVDGTLMGFWCPEFMNGVNVAGLHLHFLSADRRHGGHVLNLSLKEATVSVDDTNGWDVQLPMIPAYLNADLGADNGGDLKSAEQGGAVSDASAH